jgi:hypothetical protein
MGILSNLFLFNTLFNNAESSNAHDDDDLDIEIVEGEIEIETDDTDTLNDILEKVKQKLEEEGLDCNDAILELEFDDEASNAGRSKEQYFKKVLQDPSQFETKE